jgi:hypothetical protein
VITAPSFKVQAESTGFNNGVPVARVAVYPGAFFSHTDAQVAENTTKILFPEIVDALTKPIEPAEVTAIAKAMSGNARDIVCSGTIDEVNNFFLKKNWTDGLPVIPPTVDRVEEFLKYTSIPPDQTVAVVPIAYRNITPWTIAVNGVMAGCPPEYMPLLIAYVKSIDKSKSQWFGSTHSWIPYVWINGPVSRQLGIDYGQALITSPENAVIGRFLGLAVKNLAGFNIKQDRMGSFGYTVPWCLAENEEWCRQIDWKPYHVRQGYDVNKSTLTSTTGLMWGNNLIPATADPKIIMQLMAWAITENGIFEVDSGFWPHQRRTLLISPSVAQDLARVYSQESLEEDLIKTARRPAFSRAFASFYATPGSLPAPSFEETIPKTIKAEEGAEGGLGPWFPRFPGWEKIVTVPVTHKGATDILVCGDDSRNKAQVIPGGTPATVEIDLPTNWDRLMAERGYRPLKDFFLK